VRLGQHGGVQHASHLHAVGVQGRWPPADAAARSGRGQPFEGALDDELPEELVEGAEHVELQASTRCGGVDALPEHQEIDLALAFLWIAAIRLQNIVTTSSRTLVRTACTKHTISVSRLSSLVIFFMSAKPVTRASPAK
jgi:hypothetical protein